MPLGLWERGVINHNGKVNLNCKVNNRVEVLEFYVTMTKTPRILGVQAREKLGLIQRTNTPSRCPNQRDPSVEVIHPNHLTCQDVLEEFKDEFAGLPVSSRITSLSTTWSLSYTHPVEPPWSAWSSRRKACSNGARWDHCKGCQTNWLGQQPCNCTKEDGSLRLFRPQGLEQGDTRRALPDFYFEDVISREMPQKVFHCPGSKGFILASALEWAKLLPVYLQLPFWQISFPSFANWYLFRTDINWHTESASRGITEESIQSVWRHAGVEVIADDMIAAGATEKDHNQLLGKVMQRAREQNVKFNPKKIQFKQQHVVYSGIFVSEDGIRPDRAKRRACIKVPMK